jgi:hypothetical protein
MLVLQIVLDCQRKSMEILRVGRGSACFGGGDQRGKSGGWHEVSSRCGHGVGGAVVRSVRGRRWSTTEESEYGSLSGSLE